MNADAVYRPLGAYDIRVLRFIMLQIAIDLGLYGVQATLSIAAIAILARREGRSRSTLAAILGIVLLSTIIVAENYTFWIIQIPTSVGTSERPIDNLLLTLDILSSAARNSVYVLSDAVLVWRAWCLWPDNRLVRGILSLCACGTVVGSVAECVWLYWPHHPTFSAYEDFAQSLTRLVPLLVTNVIATAMIGIWVCRYRREIKGSLGVLTQKTRSERVLMLLLESGLLYCSFWVYLCTMFFVVQDDGFSSKDAFGDAAYHISGIYPTCVLFVSMQDKTKHSLLSAQMSQAMHFASTAEPREEAREAGMPSDFEVGRIDSPHDSRPRSELAEGLPCSSLPRGCAEAPPENSVLVTLEGDSVTV